MPFTQFSLHVKKDLQVMQQLIALEIILLVLEIKFIDWYCICLHKEKSNDRLESNGPILKYRMLAMKV